MKTIFICIDWFHPAYKAGGPVQSIANLVEQYRHTNVQFKIFTSAHDLDGSINEGVRFDEWNYYNPSTQVWYASTNKRAVKDMRSAISDCRVDVLFVVGVFSWYFNQLPLLFCKAPVKIMSARGMLHSGALSQKSFKKKVYLALWRAAGISHRYFFHATDEPEKKFIQQTFGKDARVYIAGNFPHVFKIQVTSGKSEGALRLVSIALISAMKNILWVLEALQSCKGKILYDIYGPVKDEVYWRQCLAQIRELPPNVLVTYKGDVVPTKIEAVLRGYEVFILPSKSENFGHAIYEALSAGKPVITSHYTPFNKLTENKAGWNVSVENPEEITKAIDHFAAMSPTEFAIWNTGANSYATKYINVAVLRAQYDVMFGVGSGVMTYEL